MIQGVQSDQFTDVNGNPEGGTSQSCGLLISWQRGPLGYGPDRQQPNGCFVETVIYAAKERLEFYQDSKFACQENADAIRYLEAALEVLHSRTANRQSRGVEGTHTV